MILNEKENVKVLFVSTKTMVQWQDSIYVPGHKASFGNSALVLYSVPEITSIYFPVEAVTFFMLHIILLFPFCLRYQFKIKSLHIKICFACPILQMLTSKDANFIGYTFKKSDILNPVATSGELLKYFY